MLFWKIMRHTLASSEGMVSLWLLESHDILRLFIDSFFISKKPISSQNYCNNKKDERNENNESPQVLRNYRDHMETGFTLVDHTFKVSSAPMVARNWPFGENETSWTIWLCAGKVVGMDSSSAGFHTVMHPLLRPLKKPRTKIKRRV